LGRRGLVFAGGTMGFVGQSGKGFRLVGARAAWRDGLDWPLLVRNASTGPGVIQGRVPQTCG